MALQTGTRVGIYEVTGKLGEGGMGEVYRAHDTTLDRDVALKVLSEGFTADPDRLARFQREAKVLASLNHPNIGAIHGLESAGEIEALVLELIEGPTLADRIAEGPLSADETVSIASQIADALEAAHEQGIIHRDLKPANVKVRQDGTVKVLDFGLAKAVSADTSGTSGSESPTMSLTGATQMGMVVGTAAYMSPEQATGKAVDKRTDVWAFGVVLYEMLTGHRAFQGPDASHTLAAVLMKEIEWSVLPNNLSGSLERLLRRCLDRDPKQRLRDIGEARIQLENPDTDPTPVPAPPVSVTTAPLQLWQKPMPLALAGVLIVITAGLAGWSLTASDPVQAGLMRFALTTEESETPSYQGLNKDLAVSPDGKQVVYMSAEGGMHLNLRPIDQLVGAPLRGAETIASPFVSPDNEWVGFTRGSSVEKVSMFGGPPVFLTDSPQVISGADWGLDDQIIFGTFGAGLFMVPGGGGEPVALTTLNADEGETAHVTPSIVSGRQVILFVIAKGTPLTTGQLAAVDLETGDITELGLAGVSPHYVPTGHIVYASEDGSLRGVPFDTSTLEITGNPVPLVEDVVVKITGASNFGISDNGRLVYARGSFVGSSARTFVWVDREGNEEIAISESSPFQEFSLSPDGTKVAVRVSQNGNNLWIFDLIRNTNTRLTFENDPSFFPVWSPDGEIVAFGPSLSQKAADGTGELASMTDTNNLFPQSFSPNEDILLVQEGAGNGTNLGMLPLNGDGTIEWLLTESWGERNAALSPDGNWVAYESNETGQYEVYVRPFPDIDSGRWEVSSNGGVMPVWNPTGGELFFRSADGMMALSYDADPTFRPGSATPLFDMTPYFTDLANRRISVAPDGERFLLLKNDDTRTTTTVGDTPQINIILNWFDELTSRVPVP